MALIEWRGPPYKRANISFTVSRSWREGRPPSTWQEDIESIAILHGVTVADLKGGSRVRKIAWARHHVMYRLRQRGNSFPWIAARLNMKNHTSCIHGCRAHAARIGA